MIQRCKNKRHISYPNYGARGITVCAAWHGSFAAFFAEIGERPSPKHSLDRIDVNGHYEPGNVRWATTTEQRRNTRVNVRLTLNGETRCLTEWAQHIGIDPMTLKHRLFKLGMTLDAAVALGRGSTLGIRNGCAKLTVAKVQQIRARRAAGDTYAAIARDMGVSRPAIADICAGRKWKHVPTGEIA